MATHEEPVVEDWEIRSWDEGRIADSGNRIGSDRLEPQQEGASMRSDVAWEGKDVEVAKKGLEGIFSNKQVVIQLTTQAARELSISLARLKQKTMPLIGSAEELRQALDFVLVGDPASRAHHRRMEAGKGMTPDGGYKTPEDRS